MTEKRKRDGVRSAQSSTKVLRRMLSAAAVLFVLCLVFMAPASADDYYVSPSGTGLGTESTSPGSLTDVLASIKMASANTEHTVHFAAGEYTENYDIVRTASGVSVTLIPVTGDEVTISGTVTIWNEDPGRSEPWCTVEFNSLNFKLSGEDDVAISVPGQGTKVSGHPNPGNIKVINCNFVGTYNVGEKQNAITSGSGSQTANLSVSGCTFTNVSHVIGGYYGCADEITISGNEMENVKSGISINNHATTGGTITITDNEIDAVGYCVRIGSGSADIDNVVISNNVLSVNGNEDEGAVAFRGGSVDSISLSENEISGVDGAALLNFAELKTPVTSDDLILEKNSWDDVESELPSSDKCNFGNGYAIGGTGSADDPYLIKSKFDLEMFRDSVNAGNNYAKKTVKLTTDIDLNNEEWTPIQEFNGVFDGGDHTISNLVVNGEGKSNQGFFGNTYSGEIKNLNIDNAKVSGRLNVGVVAGNPYTSKYTNITVTGHVEVNGMAYVGGVGGKNAYADWTNITVDVDDSSYVKADSVENGVAYRTYVGGVIGFMGEGGHTFKNIYSNIKVIGSTIDVGGIAGIAHYGNNFENVVCEAPSIEITNADEEESARQIGGIAGVWHNQNGYNVTFKDCVVGENTVLTSKIVDSDNQVVSILSSENGDFGNILSAASYNKDTQGILKVQETDENGNVVSTKVYQKDENGVEKSAVYSGDVRLSSDGTITSPDSSGPATPSVVLYEIDSAADLFAFAEAVNGGKTYAGETITLTADINLKNEIWTPIGLNGDAEPKFKGTFDGNDKTIYNLNVNTSLIDGYSGTYKAAGLFGATRDSTIKNLTIDGAYVEHVSSGSVTVNGIAVLAGSTAYGATIENITVKNAVVKGNRYVAGIVGYADGTIRNCHVENVTLIATPDKLTGSYDNGDKVGGIIGLTNSGIAEISGCSANDVDITAYRDAGGIVGALTGNDIVISDNSVSNIDITIDQFTNSYGSKPTNAGAVAGRLLINDGETSNPNEEEVETKNVVTAVKVTTIDTTGEITVDLGFSYEIDTVYLTGDSTSGYSVLENSVIHLPLNYSVTAESSPADVWYVNVTVTDENEAPVQVAHSLSSSVIDASYFQYHEKNKVYQVSNNGLVGVDKDTPALFKLDLETAALDAGKKYNVTIEITTVATTDIVGEASLYSYDAVSELEIQIGIDAWVISVDHNLYNTTEEGNDVATPWGLDYRAHIVYEVKNPYNGKDTTYFSNEDNTIVKRNANAPYGLNLSGSVKQTIVKIVGGEEKAVAAGTKITAENGKLVMTVADADLDAASFKITFDGQKAGDLSNIKAFPDTIDVIDANYILKELAATGNYIPADFKVFADVTKDAKIDTDDATLVFFFGLNNLADELKTSVELEYPTA